MHPDSRTNMEAFSQKPALHFRKQRQASRNKLTEVTRHTGGGNREQGWDREPSESTSAV